MNFVYLVKEEYGPLGSEDWVFSTYDRAQNFFYRKVLNLMMDCIADAKNGDEEIWNEVVHSYDPNAITLNPEEKESDLYVQLADWTFSLTTIELDSEADY